MTEHQELEKDYTINLLQGANERLSEELEQVRERELKLIAGLVREHRKVRTLKELLLIYWDSE